MTFNQEKSESLIRKVLLEVKKGGINQNQDREIKVCGLKIENEKIVSGGDFALFIVKYS